MTENMTRKEAIDWLDQTWKVDAIILWTLSTETLIAMVNDLKEG